MIYLIPAIVIYVIAFIIILNLTDDIVPTITGGLLYSILWPLSIPVSFITFVAVIINKLIRMFIAWKARA